MKECESVTRGQHYLPLSSLCWVILMGVEYTHRCEGQYSELKVINGPFNRVEKVQILTCTCISYKKD